MTKTTDRRIGFLFLAFVGLLGIGLIRAGYLGSFRAGALQRAAQTQQVQKLVLPAERGTIIDGTGVQLAISEAADDIAADPHLIKQPLQAARKLSPVLGVPVSKLQRQLSRPRTGFVYIAHVLPAAKAQEAEKLVPAGLTLLPRTKRVYPRADFAGQVLGWTGYYGYGISGLEYQYNQALQGRDGQREIVNDGAGKPISINDVKPAHTGKTVKLTLDAPLQDEVEQVLAGVGAQYSPRLASAIVMNPQTGAILAMANWPRVNAGDPAAAPYWAQADHALSYNYEPGSTFKAITVAGALQDGLITPSTQFNIPPVLQVADRQIHDAENHGFETLSTAGILQVSSNIGADLIGAKLGAARFNHWVHQFGFGSGTGVDLPGEDPGLLLRLGQYSGSTMANLPFGQGESVTPMQIAAAYSAIANGGFLRPPHIVQAVGGKALPVPTGRRILSATTASELRQMLKGVYGEGGTASGAGIHGYDMAGKTGTANIAVGGHYSDTEFNASFVGMVPADHPQLLGLIVVDQPQGSVYGGSVAAPAFQKIVGWAVPYLGLPPR